MRNYIKCLLSLVFCVFYPVSGMIVPIQKIEQQFLPKDCLKQVQWKCDLQSLGRLAATCSYMNDNWQVENFSKEQFNLVEKCLYYYAPKTLFPNIDPQQITQRLCSVMSAHKESIDEEIRTVFESIKKTPNGRFFVEKLNLTDEARIAFYYGKVPGEKSLSFSSSEHDSDSEDFLQKYACALTEDVLDAAYEDAKLAIMNGNAERARVVLDRYEQFANYDNDLIEALCFLGNRSLLLKYLSIPERSVEYAMAPSGYTAIEIARDECEDYELVAFLEQAIQNAKK